MRRSNAVARLARLFDHVQARVSGSQRNIPTYFDNLVRFAYQSLSKLPETDDWTAGLTSRHSHLVASVEVALLVEGNVGADRYASWNERSTNPSRAVDAVAFALSQGVTSPLQWRGLPLFKTAFEFYLYTALLAELKPASIIELGAGSGGGAVWLADMLATLEIEGHVYAVDLDTPKVVHRGVTFITGDVGTLAQAPLNDQLSGLPGPLLIIEDAHTEVPAVLSWAHGMMKAGDYLVVEDSELKRAALSEFFEANHDCYKVDTRYTDHFGRNVTSAMNSVFVRGAR